MRFIYNDGGRSKYFKAEKVGDCVTRAIAIATGKDYKEVYDALFSLSKKMGDGHSPRGGVDKKVFKKYLEGEGWTWYPTMRIGQGCKVHLRDDELPNGRLIVSVSNHLTCVIDGVLNDTYDCTRDGRRCVYGFFKKIK